MGEVKRRTKIEDIIVAYPKKKLNWLRNKHPSIEDTGRGTTLCYEAWGGRLFFSDEGAVREAVDKFVEDLLSIAGEAKKIRRIFMSKL